MFSVLVAACAIAGPNAGECVSYLEASSTLQVCLSTVAEVKADMPDTRNMVMSLTCVNTSQQ